MYIELTNEDPEAILFEEETRCGKPHNGNSDEKECLECQMIKYNL